MVRTPWSSRIPFSRLEMPSTKGRTVKALYSGRSTSVLVLGLDDCRMKDAGYPFAVRAAVTRRLSAAVWCGLVTRREAWSCGHLATPLLTYTGWCESKARIHGAGQAAVGFPVDHGLRTASTG